MSSILDQYLPSTLYGTNRALYQEYRRDTLLMGVVAAVVFFCLACFAAPIAAAIFGVLVVYVLRLIGRWNAREDFARDKEAQSAAVRRLADGKEKYIQHLSNLVKDAAGEIEFLQAWLRLLPEAKRIHQELVLSEAMRVREEREAHWRAKLAALTDQGESDFEVAS